MLLNGLVRRDGSALSSVDTMNVEAEQHRYLRAASSISPILTARQRENVFARLSCGALPRYNPNYIRQILRGDKPVSAGVIKELAKRDGLDESTVVNYPPERKSPCSGPKEVESVVDAAALRRQKIAQRAAAVPAPSSNVNTIGIGSAQGLEADRDLLRMALQKPLNVKEREAFMNMKKNWTDSGRPLTLDQRKWLLYFVIYDAPLRHGA